MAATGKTPILLYGSTTPTNAPTAGNLTNSSDGCEIAINVADKNLFFKDSTNVVNTVPIRQSSASSNGWLSSTDWSTFNGKQPAGTYVTSVTGTAPVVSSGGTTPAISMAAATGSVNGYLTSTDWTTFNNKAPAFTYTSTYIPYGQGTTTPTQSANLTFNGSNLGVNTASPPAAIAVTGAGQWSANNYGKDLVVYSTANPTIGIFSAAGNNPIGITNNSGNLAISKMPAITDTTTAPTEWIRFFSSGGVSIGNTTDPGAANLYVSNNTFVGNYNSDPTFNRVNAVVCTSTGAVRARQTDAWNIGRADTSGTHIAFYTDNGSARVTAGNINSNGGTTNYATSSDYRMKENVQPMANAIDKVMQLNPVTYTWKAEFAGTNLNGQGFIAHELQAVVPDCVTGEKDAFDRLGNILDAEGKVLQENVQEPTKESSISGQIWKYVKDSPRYQGIDTSFLVATLTKAIQELNLEVQLLKSKLEIKNGIN
jgi:hypothetical protein